MKRTVYLFPLLAGICSLVLALTGCQQSVEAGEVSLLYADGTAVVTPLSLELEENVKLTLDSGAGSYSVKTVSVSDRHVVSAAWVEGTLLVGAQELGESTITLTLSGKGGERTVTLPVLVQLPGLPLTLEPVVGTTGSVAYDGENESVTLYPGTGGVLAITTDPEATLSLEKVPEEFVTAELSLGMLRLQGVQAGSGELVLIARREGYADTRCTLNILVAQRPLTVEITGDDYGQEGLVLEVGKHSSVKIMADPDDALMAYSSDNPAITVTSSRNVFTFSCADVTQGKVTFTVTRNGYDPLTVEIPVQVIAKKTPLTLRSADGNPHRISLSQGNRAQVYLLADSDTQVELLYPETLLSVERVGESLFIQGLTPGEGTIWVKGTRQGHYENVQRIDCTVYGPTLTLTADVEALEAEMGRKASVALDCSMEDASLSVSISRGVARVSIRDGVLLVDPQEEGEAVLTVTAQAEGYEAVSVSIPLVVVSPRIELSAPESTVTTTVGSTHTIPFTCTPKDAAIEVGIRERVANVYYREGQLYIEALEAGETVITITARKEGYRTVNLGIPLTVLAVEETPPGE